MAGKVVAVVGAEWGSEAKGIAVAQLADQFGVHVRTGGPNAGHTAYLDGKAFVGRSIPMGWFNPRATLVVGPGAVIDLDVLREELELIEAAGYRVRSRLFIDNKAGIITKAQHYHEGGVHGNAHRAIGSTGEGVGLCRIARINRGSILTTDTRESPWLEFEQAQDSIELTAMGLSTVDTVEMVNHLLDMDVNVLLEGTQGSGLSLIHGSEWPYCTSADTNAGQLAVDAGISPSLIVETILVARTFPIRVAGNSGPLPNETSWETINQAEERTTVTKKVRRVAEWDSAVVKRAVLLNRPAKIVLTFMNYLFPDELGLDTWDELRDPELAFISRVERETGGDVVAVSYDPYGMIVKPGELEYA